ncbi:phospholipase D-like domain-containing protein [Coraliomargarita parva]|uniref:phospholipase D-like domain-containing protein n=1 Tax=Coraliomargarita parva TaxID=3014050 RepID=UPI0022B40172|nr:phospholipase D-like domain-containing protein [Coraliomargarita parva]
MIEWLQTHVLDHLPFWMNTSLTFLITNVTTVLGFVMALVILRRVISKKRSPQNFFAWLFFILLFPILAVPLYFMFGGRKSRKMAETKRLITKKAHELTGKTDDALGWDALQIPEEGVTTGNHFELLPDGESAFHRICQEIEAAEHTIHIATYILSDDATGRAIMDLLEEKAEQGVTVRLLLDSLGCWNQTRRARYRLRKAGVQVEMFMPVLPLQTHTSSNLRNHRKIAIFDNYRAITGGQNLDNRFLGATPDPERFTDFSVVTQGPAVAELTRTFLSDWSFAAKEAPSQYKDLLAYVPEEAGDSTIGIIASGPDMDKDTLWEQILRMIQEFRQQLTIITPYFIPDDVLFQSLIVKARTGRNIRLILPLRSNHRMTDIARYHFLRQLDQAGVEILFYTPRMLHGKLILADGRVGLVGSANIDMRSLFVNFEIALLHYSPADIREMEAWAAEITEHSIPFKQAVSDQNFMPTKITEDVVHLIAPLL